MLLREMGGGGGGGGVGETEDVCTLLHTQFGDMPIPVTLNTHTQFVLLLQCVHNVHILAIKK